ncbi:hypothetical protein ABL78_0736 [Leptomonas seymouri]|uniref:Uncharacterized protein n=1 Tax=Leptomonas seymouri TaxID=5684 RepID=A0A0N1PGB2_LEPSE|nr:hypothetical protein ABL78_0736 [Leptomonas seymouri]|eukprot:KPI90091.1 hypothetical protein ABL78_0736 [Leptomonas seymouri]
MSAVLHPTATDAVTSLNEAADFLPSVAWVTPSASPPQNDCSSPPKAVAAPDSTPTSTRSAHRPTVLSISLPLLEADTDLKNAVFAPASGAAGQAAISDAFASSSSAPSSPPLSRPAKVVKPSSPSPSTRPPAVPPNTTSFSGHHRTPVRAPAAATILAVPVLRLPVKECKDEVAPVKALYSRLFCEAQQRAQRLAPAQQRRRAAQRTADTQESTFNPRGSDALLRSPPARTPSVSTAQPTQTAATAVPLSPLPTPCHSGQLPQHTSEAVKCGSSFATGEGMTAFERLYRNTEQTERRERRLKQLRETQEEAFRSICTFHPCVPPPRASRQRSVSNRRCSQEGNDGAYDGDGGSEQRNSSAVGGVASSRPGSSSRRQHRSWKFFLSDQEECQARQERHLEALKKRAAEHDHAELYTGVPRSKVSEHLKTYLEETKGYKGPIKGWAERFEHYMKVKQAIEAVPPTTPAKDQQNNESSVNRTHGSARKPASCRSRSRTRSESNGAARGRSASVFHRLFHHSDERETMHESIRLMTEQNEQMEFFKPNSGEAFMTGSKGGANNSSGTPQRTPRSGAVHHSQTAPEQTDTAQETAAAVAIAAGGAGEKEQDVDASANSPQRHLNVTAGSIFDALYTDNGRLQLRREMRHLQTQDNAGGFSFHPQVGAHSRSLAKNLARQKTHGESVETVRQRRAREAAQAQAQEVARRAQLQFRYDSFAHRQAERDRKRQKDLLDIFLQGRVKEVTSCRFRPSISEVSEAIVEGNRKYTQVIDDPQVVHSLIRQRAPSSPVSTSARHGASTPPAQAGKLSARLSAGHFATEGGRPTSSTHARPDVPPVQGLAAGVEKADRSLGTGTASQWHNASAAVHTHSVSSLSSSANGLHSIERDGKAHSPPPMVDRSSPKGDATANATRHGDAVGHVHTVNIAGAATSDYLRQLESDLQGALKE